MVFDGFWWLLGGFLVAFDGFLGGFDDGFYDGFWWLSMVLEGSSGIS